MSKSERTTNSECYCTNTIPPGNSSENNILTFPGIKHLGMNPSIDWLVLIKSNKYKNLEPKSGFHPRAWREINRNPCFSVSAMAAPPFQTVIAINSILHRISTSYSPSQLLPPLPIFSRLPSSSAAWDSAGRRSKTLIKFTFVKNVLSGVYCSTSESSSVITVTGGLLARTKIRRLKVSD